MIMGEETNSSEKDRCYPDGKDLVCSGKTIGRITEGSWGQIILRLFDTNYDVWIDVEFNEDDGEFFFRAGATGK